MEHTDKHPSNQTCSQSCQRPFHVEQSILNVRQLLFIVIMDTSLAMSAILRTVITVFVPTLLMHGMTTFRNDLVALHKRCLT